MPTITLITMNARELLVKAAQLIETHGFDSTAEDPKGRVPLTLVGAMKVVLDRPPRKWLLTLPIREQILINYAFCQVELAYYGMSSRAERETNLAGWLRKATKTQVMWLINETLAEEM